MGLLDDLKKKLPELKDAAEDLIEEHDDEIKDGLDQAAELVDDKTGGKHRDKIDAGVDKAKGLVDDVASSKPAPKSGKRKSSPRTER